MKLQGPRLLLEARALCLLVVWGKCMGGVKPAQIGVAMRFPRTARLRMDEPPIEADRLETLMGRWGRGEGSL